MKWQISGGKGFLIIMPSDAGFALFLKRYKLDSIKRDTLKLHLACHYFDMNKYCRCDPNISTLLVYYNFDYDYHLMEPEYAFSNEGKLWKDPQWKILPSRFCSFLAHFTELVPKRDMRQNFLVEDLLEHFDDGTLGGASMFLDRGAECSCLLQDLHHLETSIPVPLKHILPQKFATPLLIQTLRKIDQLPTSTEASVRESTDTRIIELIPGLQDMRQKTLPQMYFEDCSVFRGTVGRVNPLFQHPEDAVMIIWKPGDYDHVYFMFMSQLYPRHEHFKIHDWSMIVFSRETTGAIKRRVLDSPAQGNVPPDGHDPIQPDQHGGDLLLEDVPIDDGSNDFLMMIINLITTLDQIQMMMMMMMMMMTMMMMMMMMIKNISSQMIMDHRQMMTWTCREYRTRGKRKSQVFLQHRFLILVFQSKRLLILEKMTILHKDLIKLLSLNQSEFKGNRDRFLMTQLMLYQRQRPR